MSDKPSMILPFLVDQLEAIQSLHKCTYVSVENEVWGRNPRCEECHDEYPCPTRKLSDEALAVTQ